MKLFLSLILAISLHLFETEAKTQISIDAICTVDGQILNTDPYYSAYKTDTHEPIKCIEEVQRYELYYKPIECRARSPSDDGR